MELSNYLNHFQKHFRSFIEPTRLLVAGYHPCYHHYSDIWSLQLGLYYKTPTGTTEEDSSIMNPDRLKLLAEHIKMSLLERKRALSLNLEPSAKDDAAIQRSLNTLLQGIEEIEAEQTRMEEHGEA